MAHNNVKISHNDPKVVSEIPKKLKKKYCKFTSIIIQQGKLQIYLRMDLYFYHKRKVYIIMFE